jgi:hypothetical protein
MALFFYCASIVGPQHKKKKNTAAEHQGYNWLEIKTRFSIVKEALYFNQLGESHANTHHPSKK